MRAGTVTLRVGTQLVGVRADSAETLARLRALLASWIDESGHDAPWVFDVRLEHADAPDRTALSRGPRPVPQLRLGQVLMARSRDADDVLRALAGVLGGVLARQDDTRIWTGMRPFHHGDRVVLVDTRPPAFSADPVLARAGIVELPTWSVASDGPSVLVPPALHGLEWTAAGLEPPDRAVEEWRSLTLGGIVALDPPTVDHDDHQHDDHQHDDRTGGDAHPAALLQRFATRHPSTAWFRSIERLVRDQRVLTTRDRSTAQRRIIELSRR